jgi:structure-specific recognition protein 1
MEHTMRLNISDEEINEKYNGQLTQEISLPMSSLIAKIFKVLSDKKVFVPKQYKSYRDTFCIKCSIKANEGLLYPLAKSFIFIHKPTVIISFDDVDYIEFKRYEPNANSGKFLSLNE